MQSRFWYVVLVVGAILGVAAVAWKTLPSQVQAGHSILSAAPESVTSNQYSVMSEELPEVALPKDGAIEVAANHPPVVMVEEIAATNPIEAMPVEGVAPSPDIENDVIEILNVVRGFTKKEEANLLGQEGWILISTQDYVPVEMRSNGDGNPKMPMSQLYPEDISFQDWWVHVDQTGVYWEGLSTIKSLDGVVRQQSVTANGQQVNLTALAAGLGEYYTTPYHPEKFHLPSAGALYILEQMQSWPGTLTAVVTENEYIVTYERWYEEPQIDAMTQELVAAEKIIYAFNSETGQLFSREFHSFMSNNWRTLQQTTYLLVEFNRVLPGDVQQLFDQAIDAMEGN